MAPAVSALYVYPVKSCRGIRVDERAVDARGFVADRRWMVVDESGTFITQREVARLTLVRLSFARHGFLVEAPNVEPLSLPTCHEQGEARSVRVWNDVGLAILHRAGSAWFSAFLARKCELVYMPDDYRRRVNPSRARPEDIVSFADGYPFLAISEASLADLNLRLSTPIGMERFRPSIVVSGTLPFAEDEWAQVRIGELTFRGVKRCDRCTVTTIDPETAEQGREPLRTLSTYRQADGKVWFGMNLIHDSPGALRVGDLIERL
jgi:uncharacterized protein YcbX